MLGLPGKEEREGTGIVNSYPIDLAYKDRKKNEKAKWGGENLIGVVLVSIPFSTAKKKN
jgi:hypothetical protein